MIFLYHAGCGNVNYPRRDSCHLCGRERNEKGTQIVMEYVQRLKRYESYKSNALNRENYHYVSDGERVSSSGIGQAGSGIYHPQNSPNSVPFSSTSPTISLSDPSLSHRFSDVNEEAPPGMRAEIINMKFKTKLCKQFIEESGCSR